MTDDTTPTVPDAVPDPGGSPFRVLFVTDAEWSLVQQAVSTGRAAWVSEADNVVGLGQVPIDIDPDTYVRSVRQRVANLDAALESIGLRG